MSLRGVFAVGLSTGGLLPCGCSTTPESARIVEVQAPSRVADNEVGDDGTLVEPPTALPSEAIAPPQDPEPTLIVSVPEESPESSPAVASCASASSESRLATATVLVALDRSSSMGFRTTLPTRWIPITDALKAFFSDPGSTGLNAALKLFPPRQMIGSCSPSIFADPDVEVTTLPSDSFAAVIDSRPPQGGTPTLPTLQGLLVQAQAIRAADPDANVAMVLVTDGIPAGCDSSINNVSNVAAAALAEQIPTYTIGVGGDLDALNDIAIAGGTEEAVLINDADPQATQAKLAERLSEIRTASASCEVAIPEPPAGKTFDPLKVSTEINSPEGDAQVVAYNVDCASGAGWRYDQLDNPTTILLCPQTCQALRAEEARTLSVVFGCEFNPQIVR